MINDERDPTLTLISARYILYDVVTVDWEGGQVIHCQDAT